MSVEEKKDLTYYLAHPDEMPEDPKEIERLSRDHISAALESGSVPLNVDTIVGKQDEKKEGAPSDAKVEEVAKPAAEAKAEEKKPEEPKAEEKKAEEPAKAEEPKPDGILAKDGKNLIPYSQLESARARAATAEAIVKEQASKIEALTAKKPDAAAPNVEMLTEEELAVLEADSPTLAKTLRAQQAAIQTLTETVKSVTQRQAEQVATEETVVKTEIQTAIDGNPTLAAWQTAEDQTMWNEASKFDKLLRESPKYADVPFADRFAKVVELTNSALGLEAPAPAVVEEKKAPTPEEVRAAAAAKLAEKQKSAKPVSLSQIPGGAPPAVDEKDKVEQMSPVALGQHFTSMSRDQLDAYLASL